MQFTDAKSSTLEEVYSKLLAESFCSLQRGSILVNANGVILRCNDFARTLLAKTRQLRINAERLEFSDLKLQREFSKAQLQLQNKTNPTQQLILRREHEFLRPIHLEIRQTDTQGNNLFFIIATDLESKFQINLRKANILFRLTQKETAVLEKLAGPQTEPKISAALNITQNTLRTHRKNIYAKLNINSRVELAMMITTLS